MNCCVVYLCFCIVCVNSYVLMCVFDINCFFVCICIWMCVSGIIGVEGLCCCVKVCVVLVLNV